MNKKLKRIIFYTFKNVFVTFDQFNVPLLNKSVFYFYKPLKTILKQVLLF